VGTVTYDLILFDADDTLFDFGRSEAAAFSACLRTFVAKHDHRAAYAAYREVSAPLWREHEARRLALYELSERRWAALAVRCGFEYSVSAIAAAYIAELSLHAHLIEGALAVCSELARTHVLGIVTNGFDSVQRARLAASPLHGLFSFMVTSEAAGGAKPSSLPFEQALTLYARPVERRRVLMVGDGAHSDMVGGALMGFSTCWYNAKAHATPATIAPDRIIGSLEELLALI
jgi:2-haloacid dehalogenase